jgi:hypothetical protein
VTGAPVAGAVYGPFGIADGHRADIDSHAFVQIDPAVAHSGVASTPEDRTARVVVGKKGSGKTVYMRRFQADAGTEESVYTAPVDPGTPTTSEIVRFGQWYRETDLTERWSQAWRTAILRSVSSHMLYAKSLNPYGDDELRDALQDVATELMPEVATPRSVYDQLSGLINTHHTGHHLEQTLRSPRWGDLEYFLGEFIRESPPFFFYLDAVDEEYASAPNYWLRCQTGLFYQVMRLLRDPAFGGRLHVVIAVRDTVLASVLRTEHATRYRTDPHIRILAWDRPTIGYFLREKLSRLDPQYVMREHADTRTVAAWLGRSRIRNEARGIEEGLEDYLLRHTRLLPRDVVLLGNALSTEVTRAKSLGEDAVDQTVIRKVVEDVARWCGNEQLAVCGNQILGDSIPLGLKRLDDVETYIGSREYQRDLTDRLGGLILEVGRDQFDGETLAQLAARGRAELGGDIDVPTVLWQNGLLGFADARHDTSDWVFHGVEDLDRFHLPVDRKRYALHPCLLDALGFSGSGQGSSPVMPWRREFA